MGIVLASNFDVNTGLPLDSREKVADNTARDAIGSGVRYEGMTVYVVATAKNWQLQGGILNANWVQPSGADATKANLAGGNTFTGTQVFSDAVIRSALGTVVASAGTNQAGATALLKDVNAVSSTSSTTGVRLPAITPGAMIYVHNTGPQPVLIYPATGAKIDALATNAGVLLKADKNYTFVALDSTSWRLFGGASSPLTTKGDLYTYGTDNVALPVGADGQVLTADSTQSTGLKWSAAPATNVIRAGVSTLANAATSVTVTFSSAMPSTSYAINPGFENTTDTDPMTLVGWVSARSTTGFTYTFAAPTDSANYSFNWQVIANA